MLEHPISDKLSPQYDVPALKTLALNHIRGELGSATSLRNRSADSHPGERDRLLKLTILTGEAQIRRDKESIHRPTRVRLDGGLDDRNDSRQRRQKDRQFRRRGS
jgi:hypothetical protein